MPNAQRLAEEGVRFSRCYCPTAHCCPSRATFQTGLYPSRHGIWNNVSTPTALNYSLTPGVTTFGPALREAGYQLAFAGKWHVSDTEGPADHGWEELVITSGPGESGRGSPRQMIERLPSHVPAPGQPRARGTVNRPGWGPINLYRTTPDVGPRGDGDVGDRKVIDSALAALPRLAAGASGAASGGASGCQPWCLFVGPHNPHDPFTAPKRFVDLYDPKRIDLPASYEDRLADRPGIYRRMRQQLWDQLGPDEIREALAHYWAKCSMADAWLGEVLDALDATGQADDTLVIFMSDHGDYAGAHGLFLKGVPAFDEAYHVPCIMRWPAGMAAPGRVSDAMLNLADFAPTFLDLAGVNRPATDFTGRSLLPLLHDSGPAESWRRYRFTQFSGVELYYTQRSVADDRYKYVYNGFDTDELYDLESDPHEMTNLAANPDFDSVKERLCSAMWRFAAREDDRRIFNPYGTVALAPFGPGVAKEASFDGQF